MENKLFRVLALGSSLVLSVTFFSFAGDLEMTSNKSKWVFFSDQVMGGKSQGSAQILRQGDERFVRLQGDVTTANNGGFIQIRTAISGLEKDIKGVSLKVRGNGERYYVFIRTSGTVLPWQYYKADFVSKTDWSEVTLEFKNFIRSSAWLNRVVRPESIKSIGIVAFGRDHKALVDLSSLYFF